MAKSRVTTNPMYTGGAGGYSFYVRKGEQVIRQRKNNSNYGSGASRTYAQMIRRIMWGNLVNVFKAMKTWQPKAYDSKKQGQTDYNIFMQLNINQATAALTREMCLSGCAVIEPCQVSRGSLPPIALALAGSGNQYVSDIVISNAITGSTTVGQLSTDILANNPQFQEGDNLAFCFFLNWKDSRVEWPFVSSRYTEITLDTTSVAVINSIPSLDNRLSKSTGGVLQVSWSAGSVTSPNNEVGMVLIHTRKSASMLAVSSQEIVMNGNSISAEFSGNTWYQTCIDTYGLTTEVPLDPSFPEASISSVTANGSAVQNAQVLSGSQIVHILGSDLQSSGVRVAFNDSPYVPLQSSESDLMYIFSVNGVVKVYVGNRLYMTLFVSDIIVPDGLPTNYVMKQAPTTQYNMNQEGAVNRMQVLIEYCINYPYSYDEDVPYFLLNLDIESEQSDYECVNCSINTFNSSSSSKTRMNLSITDTSEPAYVYYKGVIIAVFNYS